MWEQYKITNTILRLSLFAKPYNFSYFLIEHSYNQTQFIIIDSIFDNCSKNVLVTAFSNIILPIPPTTK